MPQVLALVDDHLFLSRIREAARGPGLEIRPVRRSSELLSGVRDGGRLVLVDADSAGINVLLLGICQVNLDDAAAARDAFASAARHDSTRASARQWIRHLELEAEARAAAN